MKAQERLDRVMLSCTERMQEEVSALLGKTLSFSKPETSILSKEDFFSRPAGKTVLAHVQVEGDLEGHGALLISVKDAIRIGGTLIMLPDSELEAVISDEEYTEELEDSYGEIANIICGSLTVTFDEQYPKNVRLVRTEQEVILPVKVDIDSDEPVPDGQYYLMTCGMRLEDIEMGSLNLLLPAATFGLVAEAGESAGDAESEAAAGADGAAGTSAAARPAGDEQGEGAPATATDDREATSEEPAATADSVPEKEQQAATAPPRSSRDVGKQRKLVDRLLAACAEKVGEEVGALLGGDLKLQPEENEIYSKEDLLDQLVGKQLLARFDVRGEGDGEVFLFAEIKDAIHLGGTLIMLPEAKLEEVVRNEEFSDDTEDAYGEIANIIAGVYTSVFEEQYRRKLGFVKTGLEVIVPVKIDPDSDEVIPNHSYYTSVCRVHLNGNDMGLLHVAFPAALLELEELAAPVRPQADQGEDVPGRASGPEQQDAGSGEAARVAAAGGTGGAAETAPGTPVAADAPVDVLIVTDDDREAATIAAALETLGYSSRILHFKDPVTDMLTSSVRIIFLVMEEVSEQGFGVAIKIVSSGCRLPIVAAGPAWTRTRVLKAVKYGACDILITPAGEEDVREKIEANLGRIAA